jgi:hypothetical protein
MSYDSIANALDDAHTHIRTLDARIANLERERDELLRVHRDGKWLDQRGCCRVCDGEIPFGHTTECELGKLQAENRALREALRRVSQRYVEDGYHGQYYECLICSKSANSPANIDHAPGCLAAPQEPAQEGER